MERRLDESAMGGDHPMPPAGEFPDLPDALVGDDSRLAGQAVVHVPSRCHGERRGFLVVERA
jgi:hypothetical protein